jgi:hypothetical protein
VEGSEVAPYFERRVLNNPQRAHLIPYMAAIVKAPEDTLVQSDGKIRHWRYVPELRYHIRVTATADGALFNAHEDSNYTRNKGRPE